ncbi:SMP-30/gluconolactonase/LRE family protein [Pseudonocardia ailaonensis]|uniref:SMP-30/gluconolactonase/LRE family protein n=1 Tax=Pseudonocardia ailaonensis TaxID=367279 RepID=A0ABN2N4Y1_9PSEU
MSGEPLVAGVCFAEGARWYRDRLWFSDVFGQRVVAVGQDNEPETVARFSGTELPVGLGFLPDGTPLVSNLDYPEVLRIGPDGSSSVHADLSGFGLGVVNDMIVDRAGRAYVGAVGRRDEYAAAVPGTGAVLLVEPDGSARVVADGLTAPNGPCLTPDGLYVVSELPAQRLTSFERHPDGSLSDRRTWADLTPFRADGIAADAGGGIWTSSTADGQYRRVLPGGEVTDIVEIPGRRAVACCLGGADGRSLFLLSNGSNDIAVQWGIRKFRSGRRGLHPGPAMTDLAARWSDNSRIDVVRVDVPAD